MKKKRSVTEEIEEYFCDYCGVGISPRSCHICGKHVCTKCAIPDPDDDTDYPYWYCNQCWKIGEPFREKISEIKGKAYEDEEKLIEEWKKEAKNAKNSYNWK